MIMMMCFMLYEFDFYIYIGVLIGNDENDNEDAVDNYND